MCGVKRFRSTGLLQLVGMGAMAVTRRLVSRPGASTTDACPRGRIAPSACSRAGIAAIGCANSRA